MQAPYLPSNGVPRYSLAIAVSTRRHRRGNELRSRNTRRVIALVIVVGVIVAGALAVTSQQSPEARVRAAVEALANRQTTPVIADAAGFARTTGLAFMPAGIGMTVSDWQATTTDQTVQAQWTVVATGNGASVAAAMGATFEEIGEVYAWTEAEGYLRATGLVGRAADPAAVEQLVRETDLANSAFGTNASVQQVPADDPDAPLPSPLTTRDPELWAEAPMVELKPAVPAITEQTYLVLGADRYLVHEEHRPAQPAEVLVGSMTTAELVGPAHEALQGFVAAKTAGDETEAAGHLSGADGLTASGLAASTISAKPIEVFRPVGQRGAYSVTADDLLISDPDRDGRWTIDYTGQPLAVLTFDGPASSAGELYVPGAATNAYDWQPTTQLAPATVLAGASSARIVLTGTIPYEGRGYQEYVHRLAVTADGTTHATGTPAICETPLEQECAFEITLPAGGLRTLVVSLGLGDRDDPDRYGSVEFTADAP